MVAACGGYTLTGDEVQGEPVRPTLQLHSTHGPVDLSSFLGQYVFLYFGYTNCPDICSATLAQLSGVRASVDEIMRDDVGVVMVSVDPDRDSPQAMADYVEQFDPTFVGLTGTLDEVDEAVRPFGLFYEYDLEDSDEYYLVNHTSRTYLVAPDGRLRVTYDLAASEEQILADLQHLMSEEPPSRQRAATS